MASFLKACIDAEGKEGEKQITEVKETQSLKAGKFKTCPWGSPVPKKKRPVDTGKALSGRASPPWTLNLKGVSLSSREGTGHAVS